MQECNFNSDIRRKAQIVDIAIVLVFLGLAIFGLIKYSVMQEGLNKGIHNLGYIGLVVFNFIIEIIPSILSPYMTLAMAITLKLNVHLVAIYSVVGSTIGSIIGFELGKKYGMKLVCPIFDQSTWKKFQLFLSKYGKWFVVLGALTPLPYFPILFGAFDIKRRDFFIFGVLFRILGTAVASYAYYYLIFY